MTRSTPTDEPFSVTLLELWAERIHRNLLRRERCLRALEDEGVRVAELPPRLRPADGELVVRLKEELVALHREGNAIRAEIARAGAELSEGPPLELLLPGGPEPGARLSWQPGEPQVAFWRAPGEGPGSPRRALDAGANPLTEPPRH